MSISGKRQKALTDFSGLDRSVWSKAKVAVRHPKKAVSLRVDRDVLQWFRAKGKGYSSLMNAVLRSYFEVTQKHGK